MSLLGDEHSGEVCAQFIVRARMAPPHVERLLDAEQARYRDILRVDVPWNETRMRGPVLTLASWLRYAATRLPSVRFVAKVDDDSYLHAPGLARPPHARETAAPAATNTRAGPSSTASRAARPSPARPLYKRRSSSRTVKDWKGPASARRSTGPEKSFLTPVWSATPRP